MGQNGIWEWLLEGFEFDLETRVKPRTVRYYIDHVRIFVRWAKDEIIDARTLTKRDVQRFFHFLIESPAVIILGNGTRREVKIVSNNGTLLGQPGLKN